ncbi:GGDEF domain-containing protein [Planctobacterium marinum]|uniref:GGDEF domain-containing protein n=1 Tax=Planctobacterium marinum TaxID=1631968 RepID=UPI001E34B6BC|nr:GGDEF domain-containing protein [Planctobacterium marinum]MCC2606368.1 GGDEF domain-containing protein [Planctobacterium marinum]
MNKQILDSVVSLTEQKDLDSVGISLLSTIAEYVYFEKACLYELERSWPNPIITVLLELKVQSVEPHFVWYANQTLMQPATQLVTSIDSLKRSVTETRDGMTELWVPVAGAGKKLALHLRAETITTENKSLISAFARIYGNYLRVLVESEKDKLTGLLNRHSFERHLRQMLAKQASRQKRQHTNFPSREAHAEDKPWLVIIDIDYFKKVNDVFGHVCGDEVLLTLSQKMSGYFRSSDYVFRFGGEEFVIILEPATRSDAFKKLNDFRLEVEQDRFPLVGKITVSIGFAEASQEDYEQVLMERADKAMYYAKEHGRNAVYCYEQLVEEGELQEEVAIAKESAIDLF